MKKDIFGSAAEAILAPGNPWHTHPLDYPEVLGSFGGLGRIAKRFGVSSVYLFSRVCEETGLPRRVEEGNVLGWFAFHHFSERTGIPAKQILFCERNGEARLCHEQGITCFVGTELPVLDSLSSVATRFLFFPCGGVRPRLKQHPGIELTESWGELTRQFGLPEEKGDSEATTTSPAESSGEVGDVAGYYSQVVPLGENT